MAIAFPGAEGWGAGTQGARAGSGTPDVIRVTNLNDGGSGSFRAACESSGPRYIVFDIGGTIETAKPIDIEDPYCTILGQTAPGGGITITGTGNGEQLMRIRADEVIMRYIRVRLGNHKNNESHSGDCVQIGNSDSQNENVVLDHCTFSWSTDEGIDTQAGVDKLTIQWCIFADSLAEFAGSDEPDYHNFAMLMGRYSSGKISFHHNLLSNNRGRVPKINPSNAADETIEVINNVIQNMVWRDSGWGGSHVKCEKANNVVNYINNVVKIGLDRDTTKGYYISGNSKAKVYEKGTRILDVDGTDRTGQSGYDSIGPDYSGLRESSKNSIGHSYPITVENQDDTWDRVLAGAGVTVPLRDSADVHAVTSTRNGTNRWINHQNEIGGLPTLASGGAWSLSGSTDLPTEYIAEVGSHDFADLHASGYSYGELWANGLSGDEAPTGGDSGGDGSEPDDPEDPTEGGSGDPDTPAPTPSGIVVSASADDCTQTTGAAFTSTGTRLLVGHYSAAEYNAWSAMRFGDVGLLNSSKINEVYLRIYVNGINTAPPRLRCYGFAEDDSATLSNETNVDTRYATLTDWYVAFDLSSTLDNQWTATPDISSIVEEIVARSGWTSGNAFTLVLQPEDPTWTSQERLKIMSYDGDPTLAPRLEMIGIRAPTGDTTPVDPVSDSGTVAQQLSVGANDGYLKGEDSSITTDGVRAYCGHTTSATGYEGYFLFTDLDIPQGATIDSATMTLEPGSQNASSYDLRIMADDDDDAAAPTTYADGDGRTRTTAYVDWTTGSMTNGTRYDTPDLSTILQELTNRSGWDEDSNALFFIRHQTHNSLYEDERVGWKTYEAGSSYAAELDVEWSIEIAGSEGNETGGGTPTIILGANDGTLKSEDSSITIDGTRAYCGHKTTATGYEGFFLFPDMGIPQGATINTAYMELEPGSQNASSFDLRIMADDDDDAAAPTTYADGNGRTRTTAYVDWTTGAMTNGERYDTPDLSTVLQELADRASWSETSNVLMFIRHQTHNSLYEDERVGWMTYETGAANAAKLIVTWSSSGYTPVPTGAAGESMDVGMSAGVDYGMN